MSLAKFPLGQVVITAHAKNVLHSDDVQIALQHHMVGDWGDLDDNDVRQNEIALAQDLRLMSVFHDRSQTKFYIITEWDRSVTTILLPDEY